MGRGGGRGGGRRKWGLKEEVERLLSEQIVGLMGGDAIQSQSRDGRQIELMIPSTGQQQLTFLNHPSSNLSVVTGNLRGGVAN